MVLTSCLAHCCRPPEPYGAPAPTSNTKPVPRRRLEHRLALARRLLDQEPKLALARNMRQANPLHTAACYAVDEELAMFQMLLEREEVTLEVLTSVSQSGGPSGAASTLCWVDLLHAQYRCHTEFRECTIECSVK
jgi:hypothetical protein